MFCNVKGKFSVVEYSDIAPEVARATTSTGDLVYSAGHVCINYFTVGFFKVLSSYLCIWFLMSPAIINERPFPRVFLWLHLLLPCACVDRLCVAGRVRRVLSRVFAALCAQAVVEDPPHVFHVAEKKIPHAGPDGVTVTPPKNNGTLLDALYFL